MFFLNIYIYLYISLLFIIYIRMYILQKKDKPRTAVQSIGPQTKLIYRAPDNFEVVIKFVKEQGISPSIVR